MNSIAVLFALFVPQYGLSQRVYQPTDYASASGEYVLHTAPTDPSGSGPMRGRLVHGKEEKWSAELPATFEGVGVADDGTVVGYTNRRQLSITVLDPTGKVRKQHDLKHEKSVMHGPALPNASGLVLMHDVADAAFIRVRPADQSRPAPWWTFRLSTGERAEDVVPSAPVSLAERESVYERDAYAIPGTGLTLCHWLYADFEPEDLGWPQYGAVFSLVDAHGKTVWRQPLLDDYTDRASEDATNRLNARMREPGPILAVNADRRFTLWHVRDDAHVEYAVEKDESAGWRVSETSRKPASEAVKREPAIESIELELQAEVSLGAASAQPSHPIRDVVKLGFTDDGRVEFWRREKPQGYSFVRLTASGEVESERDLSSAIPSSGTWTGFFDVAGDRWILQSLDESAPWTEIDVATGETMTPPLEKGSLQCSIAPFDGGSYVAAVSRLDHSMSVHDLVHVNADASVAWLEHQWGVAGDESVFERAVYFASGVVRTGAREFTLLGMDDLTTCDLDKRVVRRVEIESLIGRKPTYVHALLPDRSGGVYFSEGDRIHHVDANGVLAGTVTPQRSDGTRDALFDHMLAVAPDGRLWTSDGARIYRLDERGVADLVVGPRQADDQLAQPTDWSVDPLGRILIRDRITEATHVFDSSGAAAFTCRVEPTEMLGGSFFRSVRGSRDGTIRVRVKNGVARFDARGERVAVAETKAAAGVSDRRRRRNDLDADDPVAAELASVTKRPDGKWLESPGLRAALPDGRRVIVEPKARADEPAHVHFYDAKNEPVESITFRCDENVYTLSASDHWLVLTSSGPTLLLVRLADRKVLRFAVPSIGSGGSVAGQTADGKSLLVVDTSTMRVHRYALP
ncbi:MAG: hypothetical protein ACKVWV_19370 [Planctomycetota bacterium]